MNGFLEEDTVERHCCKDCQGIEDSLIEGTTDYICFLSVREVKDWVTGNKMVYYQKCSELNSEGTCKLFTSKGLL